MATSVPMVNISKKSQDALIQYYRACTAILSTTWNVRNQMMNIDRAYMREQDFTKDNQRARVANRYGDSTKFQNVTVPIVMPQVETALTYQTGVFLSGYPIFPVSSAAPYMDAARQMEVLIESQATAGGWRREISLALRDGFKYNLGAVEVSWDVRKIWTPETALNGGTKLTEVLWEGNCVKRVDPYNLIFDARYKPTELSTKGEFIGYTEVYSKINLLKFLQSLTFRLNYQQAVESTPSTVGTAYPTDYFIPSLNPEALLDQNLYQTTNWLVWAGLADMRDNASKYNFKNVYFLTTFYARILPSDFAISASAAYQPQIWKFYIVNGNTIVYAERCTNAHDTLPIQIASPLEDGLGYQTKSFAQNTIPYQQVASALMNSAMASRRRSISDRGIYDPTRISEKDINSDSPNAKIPVRPAAYGKPLNEAYFPIPYRDDQLQFAMSDMAQVMQFTDQATGQNRAQQGQFVKGNKTLFEYDNVMSNANARPQATALYLQDQFFTPLKNIIKLNILQYQKPAQVYDATTQTTYQVDPVLLRKANAEFIPSDGLLPASKVMNSESFAVAAQTIASSPAIQAGYNLAPMFSALFKSQRADVAQFEKPPEQIAFEQAQAQYMGLISQINETWSTVKKADGNPFMPEEIAKMYPPQPTPEQFGYTPGMTKPQPQGTVMQQFAAIQQSQQPQPTGNPNAETPSI